MKATRAKRYLLQIRKLDTLIKNKLIEKEQLLELALSTTAQLGGERVQASSNGHKMADAMDKYIDLEKEIDARVDELVDKKREILTVIEQLEPLYYDVLHLVYVQLLTLNDVADKYDHSYNWATTTHGRALKKVDEILAEREKTKGVK